MASTILLYNSLSRSLEPLPVKDEIGIYVCGPTVYERIHIGNARPFVLFSLLKRFLEKEGKKVTLVENITDINDKIYDAANKRGLSSKVLAATMTSYFIQDTNDLGLGRPDVEPKASETIGEIIELIQTLIENNSAYISNGDVYFRTNSNPSLIEESTESLNKYYTEHQHKEHLNDFALWKSKKSKEDTSYQAPWGIGRPGWHIECSAMAEQILGLNFEIHGGGIDLAFPHHHNERAQTKAARGQPLSQIWMHNGMVNINQAKMSKSVGNIFELHTAIEAFSRDTIIMYFLNGHYRHPLEFSQEILEDARASVDRIKDFIQRVDYQAKAPKAIEEYYQRFINALRHDFNTALAKAILFEWLNHANKLIDRTRQ
jgi:cysteinyl-tRNA synthetase